MTRIVVTLLVIVTSFLTSLPLFAQRGARVNINPRNLNFTTVNVGKTATRLVVIMNLDTTREIKRWYAPTTTSHFRVLGADTVTLRPRTNDTIRVLFEPLNAGVILDSFLIYHTGDTTGNSAKSPTKIRITASAA